MLRYAITGGSFPSATARPAASQDPHPPDSHSPAALLDRIRYLADAGVDLIQLREKHLSASDLAHLSRQILRVLAGSATRLLVNTRADVAAATGAHGVHLPATPGSLRPAQVRALFRSIGLPPPIVSQSCHTPAAIRAAHSQKPDLILFSPVFEKIVPDAPTLPGTGLAALEAACTLAAPIPVLALGGITLESTPACLAAGAYGIAGIRLFQAL